VRFCQFGTQNTVLHCQKYTHTDYFLSILSTEIRVPDELISSHKNTFLHMSESETTSEWNWKL